MAKRQWQDDDRAVPVLVDIETLPCTPDMYALLREPREGETREDVIASTSLDGTFGRVCCIAAYVPLRGVGVVAYGDDEAELIRRFWAWVERIVSAGGKEPACWPYWVGHNILGFDLHFLWQRSVMLNLAFPNLDRAMRRYQTDASYDTMQIWTNWESRSRISLDTLSRALGYPGKSGDVSGALVSKFWGQRRFREVAEYCWSDVEMVSRVYWRMRGTPPMEFPAPSYVEVFSPMAMAS